MQQADGMVHPARRAVLSLHIEVHILPLILRSLFHKAPTMMRKPSKDIQPHVVPHKEVCRRLSVRGEMEPMAVAFSQSARFPCVRHGKAHSREQRLHTIPGFVTIFYADGPFRLHHNSQPRLGMCFRHSCQPNSEPHRGLS